MASGDSLPMCAVVSICAVVTGERCALMGPQRTPHSFALRTGNPDDPSQRLLAGECRCFSGHCSATMSTAYGSLGAGPGARWLRQRNNGQQSNSFGRLTRLTACPPVDLRLQPSMRKSGTVATTDLTISRVELPIECFSEFADHAAWSQPRMASLRATQSNKRTRGRTFATLWRREGLSRISFVQPLFQSQWSSPRRQEPIESLEGGE
jgi:hypothetical protein